MYDPPVTLFRPFKVGRQPLPSGYACLLKTINGAFPLAWLCSIGKLFKPPLPPSPPPRSRIFNVLRLLFSPVSLAAQSKYPDSNMARTVDCCNLFHLLSLVAEVMLLKTQDFKVSILRVFHDDPYYFILLGVRIEWMNL